MNRLLLLPLLLLASCAPQSQSMQGQPVQVWEGTGRVLLRDQHYRLTFTVNNQTHDLKGQLENRTSGDRFKVKGTYLPTQVGATLTAEVSAGEGVNLHASILGFGISNVALKSGALLTGQAVGQTFSGELRINGLAYPISLIRTR